MSRGWARRCWGVAAACAGCLFFAAQPATAEPEDAGQRVALIIGNDAYTVGPLKNAVNDARAMDKALRSAGFKTRLLENASKEQMDEALAVFADSLGPDHSALVYYAGHAFQIENENFLVPVDFKPARGVTQAKSRCVSLAQVLEELRRARARLRVLILDSCRSNPVASTFSLTAGLAQPLNAGKDTYIAFSTSPNQVAVDAPDASNSWFTEALAGLISGPSLDIDEIFNRVRKQVQTETEGRQTPWSQSSLTSSFYFRPSAAVGGDNDPTMAQKWMDESLRREQREDWAEAIDLANRVLARKAGPTLEAVAKKKLPYFEARREAQAAFNASDFAKAAALYQRAFQTDPFASDAAMQAANSFLLTDHIPDAVGMLKAMRVRGTAASIERANVMLQELAKVSPEAGQEVKAGIPSPPPVEEVFATVRFGVPDWEAGERYTLEAPVDVTRWVSELEAAAAPVVLKASPTASAASAPAASPSAPEPAPQTPAAIPAAPATAAAAPSAVAPAPSGDPHAHMIQVEVVAIEGTRELDYGDMVEGAAPAAPGAPRRTPQPGTPKPGVAAVPKPPAEPGFVMIDGLTGGTEVLVNGKPAAGDAPGRLRLAPGSYEIRTVRGGQIVDRQTVDVKSATLTRIQVQQ